MHFDFDIRAGSLITGSNIYILLSEKGRIKKFELPEKSRTNFKLIDKEDDKLYLYSKVLETFLKKFDEVKSINTLFGNRYFNSILFYRDIRIPENHLIKLDEWEFEYLTGNKFNEVFFKEFIHYPDYNNFKKTLYYTDKTFLSKLNGIHKKNGILMNSWGMITPLTINTLLENHSEKSVLLNLYDNKLCFLITKENFVKEIIELNLPEESINDYIYNSIELILNKYPTYSNRLLGFCENEEIELNAVKDFDFNYLFFNPIKIINDSITNQITENKGVLLPLLYNILKVI